MKVTVEAAHKKSVSIETDGADVLVVVHNNGSFQAAMITPESADVLSSALAVAAKKARK